jgi:hypothetical protein
MPNWYDFHTRSRSTEVPVLYEFDDAKSRSNKAKHGIDFEEVALYEGT